MYQGKNDCGLCGGVCTVDVRGVQMVSRRTWVVLASGRGCDAILRVLFSLLLLIVRYRPAPNYRPRVRPWQVRALMCI